MFATRCTDCGNDRFVTDTREGDVVCVECGLVAQSHLAEDECGIFKNFNNHYDASEQKNDSHIRSVMAEYSRNVIDNDNKKVIRDIVAHIMGIPNIDENHEKILHTHDIVRKKRMNDRDAKHVCISIIVGKVFESSFHDKLMGLIKKYNITHSDLNYCRSDQSDKMTKSSPIADSDGNIYIFKKKRVRTLQDFMYMYRSKLDEAGIQTVMLKNTFEQVYKPKSPYDIMTLIALSMYLVLKKQNKDLKIVTTLTKIDISDITQIAHDLQIQSE